MDARGVGFPPFADAPGIICVKNDHTTKTVRGRIFKLQ